MSHLFTLPFSSHTTESHSEMRRGLKDAIPVMFGFVPFALVLGTQAAQKGFNPFELLLMTGLEFGGGSEFAAVSLWQATPPILLIVAITFLINSRHFIMGAVLAPYLKELPKRKILPSLFFMCDESWALSLSDAKKKENQHLPEPFSLHYYIGVCFGLYTTWVVFTGLGALIGPYIGDIQKWGFEMAFPAVFLVLLRGMWKGKSTALPWVTSLGVAVFTYLTIPGAWYVVSGSIAGLLTAYFAAGNTHD